MRYTLKDYQAEAANDVLALLREAQDKYHRAGVPSWLALPARSPALSRKNPAKARVAHKTCENHQHHEMVVTCTNTKTAGHKTNPQSSYR